MVEVVEEGLAKKLAKGASELKFLLTQHKVAADIQGELYENGIDTVARFAAAATDEADLKKMLKDSFSIDPSESLKLRAQAACVVVAWKTAISRVERQAFAAKFGELEDKHIPAKEYIEKKLAELESGEFRAEPLTEIISRDEVDPDTLLPHWDAKGTLSLKKGGSKTAMPSGPEQLRLRLTMLQNTPVMIQLRHPSRRELEDVNFALFGKYKEYLLGDYCYGLRSSEDSGSLVPPWSLVLSYEHAIRKHAYKVMATAGYSFGAALLHAYKEPSVKERNFTTPLALHAKRPQPWNANVDLPPTKKGRKGAKGNGKSKDGKGAKKLKAPLPPPTANEPTATTMAATAGPLRVLYLFSGTPRKLDMAACLQQLATAWTLELKTECVDVTRSAKHDLSLPKVRRSYLDRIAAKEFDAVLLSPPCSSFSRATWANFRGPRPVRSYECPRGLQTLTPAERDRAITGNIFADFSYEVAALVADGAGYIPRYGATRGLGKRTLELILEQLEKEAFRMAAGGEKGCTPASDQELHRQLRDLWKDWLEAQDLGEAGLLDVAPQPLHLRLLRAMLEAAGDPDRDFLREAEDGLPLGILDPLPRTPHVFEEQDHADFARAKFEEDVSEGLMAKMSMGEFLERYGEHTAIAALAVIVEDEELDKKRIIHDATHGVRVNHRVKCRDKLRSPGAREKKHLLRAHEEEGETAFSVVGDIAKAHRRYKHSAKEHGYLACQVDTKASEARYLVGRVAKGDPGKVIAALELLATLVGVRLWVPDGDAKKTSRVAIRGYTDHQSNESLQRRDLNQLADDLTNENFASFDPNFRIDLKGDLVASWATRPATLKSWAKLRGPRKSTLRDSRSELGS
ncbi:hypothetical protein AK812_SmicGene39223 [Symbiodinium microadriaticum]|uniref:Uncharacterized protein n=1 Tax=Symbiodinium microadriaticum TaxID=2951 RepID=A0A1Q9CBU7_SYMMI|nr:hypothetical protein AK812_SmicGene39223 [Symbiodinium microadriaticum]